MEKEENSNILPKADSDNEAAKTDDTLQKCEREKGEYLEGWRRAKADLMNYKKEEAARLENFLKFGNEVFVRELLGVLDSFELAIGNGKKTAGDPEGLQVIFIQFWDILKKFGLERISVLPGENFDVSKHEAVAEMESGEPAGTVAEEVSRGYLLNGKVIRPSKVKLSKGQK